MNSNLSDCFTFNETWLWNAEQISYLIVLPLLLTFGFVGNLIILMVYLGKKRERKQTISIILSYVAIGDIWMLFCSLWIFTFAKRLIFFNFAFCRFVLIQHKICLNFYCMSSFFRLHFAVETAPYVFALGQTCSTLSVWLGCLITFERFWAVCHPIKHREWFDKLPIVLGIIGALTLFSIGKGYKYHFKAIKIELLVLL